MVGQVWGAVGAARVCAIAARVLAYRKKAPPIWRKNRHMMGLEPEAVTISVATWSVKVVGFFFVHDRYQKTRLSIYRVDG